jgi:N-acetylated-alpha-linked acidic dipeptidase
MDLSGRQCFASNSSASRKAAVRFVIWFTVATGSICAAPILAQQTPATPTSVFGYQNFSTEQSKFDQDFLAVPDAKLAGEELKTLTAAPHVAGSKEDYDTAVYVAKKFKEAGLDTKIVPYKAWMNLPNDVHFTATSADGKEIAKGPTREHVEGDPYQDDPRILPAFNGSAASGDVTGDVVYANYGRPEDFKQLKDQHIDLRGKIILVRYGENFRGVKVYIAQKEGAAGVIIYSDPADDGYFQGDKYPKGPYRPDTGIQRGSVQYLFKYPGDATTPGIASTTDLPASKRLPLSKVENLPTIPSMPISYHDAAPILEQLAGAEAPRSWQGALPFDYHIGGDGSVRLHLVSKEDFAERTIWDVVGTIHSADDAQRSSGGSSSGSSAAPGSFKEGDDWVVAGNHRDAWVYGAVDPNSGTAAMLESVHGLGVLLKEGWKPKRTIQICSWDAEEEGLIGSTEWVEDHAQQLEHAVAYFNTDVGVGGPDFEASAVPSLKRFVREVTTEVSSPQGGTLYAVWLKEQTEANRQTGAQGTARRRITEPEERGIPRIGDLGSGSDYTPFLQHAGVPSTDIGSGGKYGVYHSVFDNYAWFTKFADPTFAYEQQQARVFGLEILHMADADVLPYDYVTYAKEIAAYIAAAQTKANQVGLHLDFTPTTAASDRFMKAATAILAKQQTGVATPAFNKDLRAVEDALLDENGLPGRSWYKHLVYAPGEFTGYSAVVIPGVNEAIDANDSARAEAGIKNLTNALSRAARVLEDASFL